MKTKVVTLAFAATLALSNSLKAQNQINSVPVTADNFVRAETDLYFGGVLKDAGGLARFFHNREPTPIDRQTVIRMTRDTLYSAAIFDLDAGPVTITLPDAGKRFMSMQIINQDKYTPMVVYRSGPVTLTRDKIGTRYVAAAIRTLVDPNDPKDMGQVHALQDAIKVSQKAPGTFDVPNWDSVSQRRFATRYWCWGRRSPTPRACSAPGRRLILCGG